MPNCILYDKVTNKPLNVIVAEITDVPPDGFYLKLLPENTIWNGTELITINENFTSNFIDNSKDI